MNKAEQKAKQRRLRSLQEEQRQRVKQFHAAIAKNVYACLLDADFGRGAVVVNPQLEATFVPLAALIDPVVIGEVKDCQLDSQFVLVDLRSEASRMASICDLNQFCVFAGGLDD